MLDDPERPSERAAEEVRPTPTEPISSAGKRLTSAQWAEIETHWECGTMTAAQLMKEYTVSGTALHEHFKRHKIKHKSKVHVLKKEAEVKIMGAAAAAIDPRTVDWEAKKRGRISETREHIYSLSRANFGRAFLIAKAIQDGTRKEAECSNDMKMIRHMEAFIEKNLANRLGVLQADSEVDESQMPTLIFRDLTEEEIQRMAAKDTDEDDLDVDLSESSLEAIEDEVVEETDR